MLLAKTMLNDSRFFVFSVLKLCCALIFTLNIFLAYTSFLKCQVNNVCNTIFNHALVYSLRIFYSSIIIGEILQKITSCELKISEGSKSSTHYLSDKNRFDISRAFTRNVESGFIA